MNIDNAVRLVRKCIPVMRQKGEPVREGLEDQITSSNTHITTLCRLWAGMGHVHEVSFMGHCIIIKMVSPQPKDQRQSIGDQRKADSYLVEANFYEKFADELIEKGLSVPTPYHVERGTNDQVTICMSKLSGDEGCCNGEPETRAALQWLATLHAATWGNNAVDRAVRQGLQPVGGYWHLNTRPDEHASMPNKGWQGRLRKAAKAIDARLKRDTMQCCLHGDAKDANMLWSKTTGGKVSVVMCDFQYCGKGPPSSDLAYFFCVAAHDNSNELLEYYHDELVSRLEAGAEVPTLADLKESLSLAYCDFARFMSGWGFWGIDLSSEVKEVLDRLDGGSDLGSEEAYDEAVRREYG